MQKSFIWGKQNNVPVSVEDSKITTAFGELAVAEFRPQCGWTFNYNINQAVITQTEILSGTVTQEGSFAKMESGTDPNAVAFIRTQRALVYSPGIGAIARFTAIFDTPQPNSIQLIGIGNNDDGWFFGYNGTQFGIMRRRNGVDEWTYQTDWSLDKRPELNPQVGNVYQIKYQWLGFGMQYFGIENELGNVENVHNIEYSNANDDVSVLNPSLPLAAGVGNLGNTTSISLKTPSAVAGSQGIADASAFSTLVAYTFSGVVPGGVDNYMFSIRMPDTYLGKDNRLFAKPLLLTIATEGNKPVTIKVRAGSVLTNPVWVDIAPNISPLQYDESATVASNGRDFTSFSLAKADSDTIDLSILRNEIHPNQSFSIFMESTQQSEIRMSVTFESRI